MSKIEPIDDDQDYPDAEIIASEAANYKDDDDGGGGGSIGGVGSDSGGGGVGGGGADGSSGSIPIENSNIDDTEKEAIDSKPILGSLNNSSANIDDANERNANDSVGQHQRRNSNGNGSASLCNANANETNLNDSETNDRSDIDNKLAPATTSTQNGKLAQPISWRAQIAQGSNF